MPKDTGKDHPTQVPAGTRDSADGARRAPVNVRNNAKTVDNAALAGNGKHHENGKRREQIPTLDETVDPNALGEQQTKL